MAIQKVFGDKEVYKCEKCGHTWMKRGDETPLICPKCKTARWNKSQEKKK
jgi:rubrerythrin|tara:strand:- start:533 stop:682 length:150 start_codon:yes stop_codon:yes gene_type:complete